MIKPSEALLKYWIELFNQSSFDEPSFYYSMGMMEKYYGSVNEAFHQYENQFKTTIIEKNISYINNDHYG